MPSRSPRVRPSGRLPPRAAVLDFAVAAYLVVLVVSPVALPRVVSDATGLTYAGSLAVVAAAVAVGLLVGLAGLVRAGS